MIKAIIFDKDGTLLDAGIAWDEPSIRLTDQLLAESQLSEEDSQKIRQHAGIINGRVCPNTLFSAGSLREQADFFASVLKLDAGRLEERIEHHFLQAIRENPQALQVIPGVREALDALSKKYVLAMVTNDHRSLTELCLEVTGLKDYFEFVGCADEFGEKPQPRALEALQEDTGILLKQMVYVGDSTVDMVYGGHTAASIGYAPNRHQADHLKQATCIFSDFNKLPALIQALDSKGKS